MLTLTDYETSIREEIAHEIEAQEHTREQKQALVRDGLSSQFEPRELDGQRVLVPVRPGPSGVRAGVRGMSARFSPAEECTGPERAVVTSVEILGAEWTSTPGAGTLVPPADDDAALRCTIRTGVHLPLNLGEVVVEVPFLALDEWVRQVMGARRLAAALEVDPHREVARAQLAVENFEAALRTARADLSRAKARARREAR